MHGLLMPKDFTYSKLEIFIEEVKQSDWDSVLCIHQSLRMATTWDYIKSTMGKYKIDNDRFKQDENRFSNITATVGFFVG
jgi:hypothetical protein